MSNLILNPLDYRGVELGPSRVRDQVEQARHYYVETLDSDDILHGFRRAAGLPAPGKPLSGWCADDSRIVFGQWLSGLARFAATGDSAAGGKALELASGWSAAFDERPDIALAHYPFDKVVGGLVDVARYVDSDAVIPLLRRVVTLGAESLDRSNVPASDQTYELADGEPQEWYTLTENLVRAYETTGEQEYADFARVWAYEAFWKKFAQTSRPEGVSGLHAYSHVNSLNGAVALYRLTGDETYLRQVRNAQAWLAETQSFVTGGYGPVERTMPFDGSLGRALESRSDCFEAVCGSWAVLKLSKGMATIDGSARHLDDAERILYNGIGAALPILEGGQHTYYSDYRVSGSVQVRFHNTYACCSGTLAQGLADVHDQIYFTSEDTLFVGQYIPSTVTAPVGSSELSVSLETEYPVGEEVRLSVNAIRGANPGLTIALRQPAWASEAIITVNDEEPGRVHADQTGWIRLRRTWKAGDRISLRLPMTFDAHPVDAWHPDRVAYTRGPLALAFECTEHEPFPLISLNLQDSVGAAHADKPGRWSLLDEAGNSMIAGVRPLNSFTENQPYRVYVDRDTLPIRLW